QMPGISPAKIIGLPISSAESTFIADVRPGTSSTRGAAPVGSEKSRVMKPPVAVTSMTADPSRVGVTHGPYTPPVHARLCCDVTGQFGRPGQSALGLTATIEVMHVAEGVGAPLSISFGQRGAVGASF